MENIFTSIYENKIWADNKNKNYNGGSGKGSELDYNSETYIPFLKKFIKDNNIKSVVDLGCGDFVCGNFIYDDIDISYTGYDVYKGVISHNLNQFLPPKYNFIHLDFYSKKEEIVSGELCIIKDVMQHWQLEKIYCFLDFLTTSNKFKFILVCNCSEQKEDNTNIEDGGGRPLNSNYFPLKKYQFIECFKYKTKQVSFIKI